MIRSPKPRTEEQIVRESIRATKEQIKAYSSPSTLGPRHDAHVRARWNLEIAALTIHLDGLKQTLKAVKAAA